MKSGKTIYLALSGASGKMGRAVGDLAKTPALKVRVRATAPPVRNLNHWQASLITGVIDFSSPPLFEKTLQWCIKNNKPFVSGTTALSPSQKRRLKAGSKKIPLFYEENMSWGIWQIRKWIKNFYPVEGLQWSLEDIHHKYKKDAPSGTALKLRAEFPPGVQKKLKVISHRRGREFGTHRLVFEGFEETIKIEHQALNRKLFARGALTALRWLIHRPPGLYTLDDLYSF